MERRAFLIGFAALLAPLAGCGRKSSPRAPEGATYPRTYPTGAAVVGPGETRREEDDESPPQDPIPPALPTYRY